MENLIFEYETQIQGVTGRMHELQSRVKTETLRTKEREHLQKRIEILEKERLELISAICEMKDRDVP